MSDIVTEVATVSLGTNLGRSIKGMFLGVLFFFGSFVLLWFNEGRVDLSIVAKKSILADPSSVNPEHENKLVALSGTITNIEEIGIPTMIRKGPYLSLSQEVEMYAWVEKVDKKTTKQTGGSSKEETTYTYETKWTSSPKSTSSFKYPKDHENPSLPIQNQTYKSPQASIGKFLFRPTDVSLPSSHSMLLSKTILAEDLDESEFTIANDTYLFQGLGSLSHPKVGDIRISFSGYTPQGLHTLIGQQHGSEIIKYHDKAQEVSFFRLFQGDRDQAISTLSTEHKIMTWVLRILGCFLMWIGLSLILSPINAFLDIIPFLGSAGRFVTGLAALPIAIALSLVTILVSIITHNLIIILLIVVAILAFIGIRYMLAKKQAV